MIYGFTVIFSTLTVYEKNVVFSKMIYNATNHARQCFFLNFENVQFYSRKFNPSKEFFLSKEKLLVLMKIGYFTAFHFQARSHYSKLLLTFF